jgi:ABC-type glycerol-3-phosphate transport system substrate-binding protein
MKKVLAVVFVCVLAVSMTFAQGSSESSSQSGAAKGKQVLNFWYHSSDPITDAYFKQYFEKLNKAQSQYEVVYTSFNFATFEEKFQMAVMTDTMPDVVSLGFSNLAAFIAQDKLLELDGIVDQIEGYKQLDSAFSRGLRNIGNGKLYGIPFAYNQEVAWYNTQKFKAYGLTEAPKTQREFLENCKKFADPANSSYFYSLRGVRPYDSLVAWLWTYTDGLGYDGSWFDENGKCILRRPEFVDALNAYADIYKNKWVSGDSVNNNFSQIVAEFGSGVSAYIIHNSSSESTHEKNLGKGNFAAARVLANDKGNYYASGLQPNVYCIPNQGKGHDYAGAIWLISQLTSQECVSGLCREVGRVPTNVKVKDEDWYKNDPEMLLYASYLSDPHYHQIDNPYWLPEFSGFITTEMTADFQAVLMGDMKASDCLAGWADKIDQYQASYKASH